MMTEEPRVEPQTPEKLVEGVIGSVLSAALDGAVIKGGHRHRAIVEHHAPLIEKFAAQAHADLAEKVRVAFAEWLHDYDGRIEDIFALWVQGKRDAGWVADRLASEGHFDRLLESPDA